MNTIFEIDKYFMTFFFASNLFILTCIWVRVYLPFFCASVA